MILLRHLGDNEFGCCRGYPLHSAECTDLPLQDVELLASVQEVTACWAQQSMLWDIGVGQVCGFIVVLRAISVDLHGDLEVGLLVGNMLISIASRCSALGCHS